MKHIFILLALLIVLAPVALFAQSYYDDYDDDDYYYDEGPVYPENSFFYDTNSLLGGYTVGRIDTLIAMGANPNEQDGDGEYVIAYALRFGWPTEAVEHLIKVGADLKVRDISGANMLMLAASGSSKAVFERLLGMDFDIAARSDYGLNIWDYAVCNRMSDILKILMKKYPKYDINSRNPSGNTLLMTYLTTLAVTDTTTFNILLAAKADPNIADSTGLTPLMAACMYENLNQIKKLVAAGAVLNATDNQGMTALMYAAEFTFIGESVEYLIDKGADATLTDNEELDAYDYLMMNEYNANDELADWLEGKCRN
jgi:ankyrin repeat protein